MRLSPRPKGVRYATLLMILVSVFFLLPAILYILEGGNMIAILPLVLTVASAITAIGLYHMNNTAWLAALILGLIGFLIFMADWVNVNVESILGSVMCIALVAVLILERKYYLSKRKEIGVV